MNGLQRVTIEAGPSTFRELYRPPEVIHELWVSTYEGETPPEEVIGDPFPELDRDLPGYVAGSTRSVEEPSGRWSFRRWRRPARSIRLPATPERAISLCGLTSRQDHPALPFDPEQLLFGEP